jgi:hypothetical protein
MPKEREPKTHELSSLDFVEGVLLATAKRTASPLRFTKYDPKIHAAFARTYEALIERAETEGLDLSFTIWPDQIHGDSQTLAAAFEELLVCGQLKLEDGNFRWLRFEVESSRIDPKMDRLPGPSELYDELAIIFGRALE